VALDGAARDRAPMSGLKRCLLCSLVVLAAVSTLASNAEARSRHCGGERTVLGLRITTIRARHASCHVARKVIARFYREAARNSFPPTILGWRCGTAGSEGECRRSPGLVHWIVPEVD
jgi:hypothetical protein